MTRLRRLWCALRGHDRLLHFEADRLSLRCVTCQHETAGWTLDAVPPTVTARGERRRHAIYRGPHRIAARRLA